MTVAFTFVSVYWFCMPNDFPCTKLLT